MGSLYSVKVKVKEEIALPEEIEMTVTCRHLKTVIRFSSSFHFLIFFIVHFLHSLDLQSLSYSSTGCLNLPPLTLNVIGFPVVLTAVSDRKHF